MSVIDAERRVPVWVALLLCLGAFALITLLVDGSAVGAFARHVQFALAAVGVFALFAGGVGLWVARRGGHVFASEEELRPARRAARARLALRVDLAGCATTRSMRRPTRRSSAA